MGRVYDVHPDMARGELLGRRLRVRLLTIGGEPTDRFVPHVTRVEFDADADFGPATVTAFRTDANGRIEVQPDSSLKPWARGQVVPIRDTFRAFVAVEPAPPAAAAMSRAVNPDHLASDPNDPIIVRHA
jgi:hypothetical protein